MSENNTNTEIVNTKLTKNGKKMGRPFGAKNKDRSNVNITIAGILLSDLNAIFKPNAIIPVDSRLFHLLSISPIDLSKLSDGSTLTAEDCEKIMESENNPRKPIPVVVQPEEEKISFQIKRFDEQTAATQAINNLMNKLDVSSSQL